MALESGWTNRGMSLLLSHFFRGTAVPSNYYVALVTAANPPDWDTNTMSDLTQIATGNGYSAGGYTLTPGETDFTLAIDDEEYFAELTIKDMTFNASGGSIPASGSGATYAVLTDAHATVANRNVLFYWYLGGSRQVSSGNPLNLFDLSARLFVNNPSALNGWTLEGLNLLLACAFRGESVLGAMYLMLATASTSPTALIETFDSLTQITAGNGYVAGGYQVEPNTTDFPTSVEDDDADLAKVAVRPIAWTAVDGNIPPVGSGASFVVLTDNNPTVANRNVLHYWSLALPRTVAPGQAMTLPDLALKLRKPT